MADYINIHGQNVEVVESDPANPTVGQIWYNSTSNTLKGNSSTSTGTWATGGNLSTARFSLGGGGTQDAALAYGGMPVYQSFTAATEEYNGSAWTGGGSLGTPRGYQSIGSIGTQTAGIASGGVVLPFPTVTGVTEEYDGSSWTTGGTMGTPRVRTAGLGIQTAAVIAGGAGTLTTVEEYNGSTWTSATALNTARSQAAGAGTQSSGLVFCPTTTEEYNGSTWTAGGNMNIARSWGAGNGSQNAALAVCGEPVPAGGNSTELYDGTSWVTDTNCTTKRYAPAGAGTQTAGLVFGGDQTPPSVQSATEEYTGAGVPLIQTITSS